MLLSSYGLTQVPRPWYYADTGTAGSHQCSGQMALCLELITHSVQEI